LGLAKNIRENDKVRTGRSIYPLRRNIASAGARSVPFENAIGCLFSVAYRAPGALRRDSTKNIQSRYFLEKSTKSSGLITEEAHAARFDRKIFQVEISLKNDKVQRAYRLRSARAARFDFNTENSWKILSRAAHGRSRSKRKIARSADVDPNRVRNIRNRFIRVLTATARSVTVKMQNLGTREKYS